MKQVKIFADFHVGNNLDSELLLEAMEAAIRDVLYDKNAEWEIANFGDVIESIDVSRIGDQYE
jgi:hypothetical protein